jgi:hypothetical protein
VDHCGDRVGTTFPRSLLLEACHHLLAKLCIQASWCFTARPCFESLAVATRFFTSILNKGNPLLAVLLARPAATSLRARIGSHAVLLVAARRTSQSCFVAIGSWVFMFKLIIESSSLLVGVGVSEYVSIPIIGNNVVFHYNLSMCRPSRDRRWRSCFASSPCRIISVCLRHD